MHKSNPRGAATTITPTSSAAPTQYYAVCDSIQDWYTRGGASDTVRDHPQQVSSVRCTDLAAPAPLNAPNYELAAHAGERPAPPRAEPTTRRREGERLGRTSTNPRSGTSASTDTFNLEQAYNAMLQRAQRNVDNNTH